MGSNRRRAHKVEQRCSVLLDALSGGEEMAVEKLIEIVRASPATIRRDLRRLERQGLVRRSHGVVARAESGAFEPFLGDPGFRDVLHYMAAEKRRIGAAAAALVQPGETVGIAPGTTAAQMTRDLCSHRDLNIVTNALNIATDLSRKKNLRVHVAGGYLGGNWLALLGPKALEFVSTMFTDKFFFGANGIHPVHGVTDQHPEEAALNCAMARQSRRRILLADHTKLGRTARCLVCRIQEVDMIITDTGATDEMVAPFRQLGIEVVCV